MMAQAATGHTRCYIGIGSNLDNPRLQVTNALQRLAKIPSTILRRRSPWYVSKALGPGDQPNYINGVIEIDTNLDPHALLTALQEIETQHGRTRTLRWGARTLDLDLLLYGEQCIDTENLQIPHPRMADRDFVLVPLADLNPQLRYPAKLTTNQQKNETIATLWRAEGETTVVTFDPMSFV